MKAVAIFPREREIRLIEHEEPAITQPEQVKIRMLEVGICGTDKEICTFKFGSSPQGSEYFILGHESFGEAVEVGSAVSRVKPGDLVVVAVRRPCPVLSCPACQVERQDFCSTGKYTERGIKESHGFMTEFVVEDEQYVYTVPRELRDVGVLVEPLTIAEKGLAELWQCEQRFPWLAGRKAGERGLGRRAVVLGAGPVGLLGMMVLLTEGFETYVYSRSPEPNPKAELVESVGAHYISSEKTPPKELAEIVGNIDVVYEASGGMLAFDVLGVLGFNGAIVFTAVPSAEDLHTNALMLRLVMRNQLLLGTVNAGPAAFTAAVQDLEVFQRQWPDALRAIITGRYPLERYEEVLFGKVEGIKNVLVIDPERASMLARQF